MTASAPKDNFKASSSLTLIDAIENFSTGRVLIIGDIMLDEYLIGVADRISPEAPVPIVLVQKQDRLLGGAGNVARNIVALGAHAVLIGVHGNDAEGETLLSLLERGGIEQSLLSLHGRPTTVKTRVLALRQQVVRIDREDIAAHTQSEIKQLLTLIASAMDNCDAIVLSDYGKGVVSAPLMAGIFELRTQKKLHIPVLVDPKPQNFRLYKGVSLLTPNAKEAKESVNMPINDKTSIISAGKAIMDQLACEHLVITLGSEGMAVFESNDAVWHIPTAAQQVFDVTGAGDTVITTLSLGLATGMPLVESCLLANYAAGVVVGKVGAATVTQNQLAEALMTQPRLVIERWA